MPSLSFSGQCGVALLLASRRLAGANKRSRQWLDRVAGSCHVLFGAHLLPNR